ncbi:MAG: hypothetical protein KatS3mg111_2361 [Pirellulaceae bacterium]|nr:MAG: hypothetical protein KatS3mg111_2361 [Pirellulaceae bacterium]
MSCPDPNRSMADVQRRERWGIMAFISPGFAAWVAASILLTGYANLPWFLGDEWNGWVPPFRADLNPAMPTHLGVEHVNVAASLVQRGQFADPFGDATGPTAWVAPLVPCVLAVLMLLVGERPEWLAVAFLLVQAVVIGVACQVVHRFALKNVSTAIAITAFACVFIPDFKWLFQMTHDAAVLSLGPALLVSGLASGWLRPAAVSRRIGWGLLGGVMALGNPTYGLAWAVATLVYFGRSWRGWATAALVSIVVVFPWTVRNYVVFEKFVPIKSNGGFEAWQAQLGTERGLVSLSSEMAHPSRRGTELGDQYRKLGEREFVRRKQAEFFAAVFGSSAGMKAYLERMANRLNAATFAYYEAWPIYRYGWFFGLQALLYPLGFLAMLLTIFVRVDVDDRGLAAIQIFFLVVLLMYVLVSFYHRYAVPLFPVRAFFIGLALQWLVDRRKRQAARE